VSLPANVTSVKETAILLTSFCESNSEPLGCMKGGEFIDHLVKYNVFKGVQIYRLVKLRNNLILWI
jgi:hypothetical protein